MRWNLFWIVAPLLATPTAWAEEIDDVLARSQEIRLQRLPAASSPAASRLQQDFERLRLVLGISRPGVRLHVTTAGTIAETLEGQVVVVHESIGDWDEPQRMFVLAHELGHVDQGHWGQLSAIYRRHIPGEVTPATTGGAVAALLGREAAGASHRQELEADAYALRAMHQLGYRVDDVLPLFIRLGAMGDTPTHPGARKRVAQLRAIEAGASFVAEGF